MSSQLMAIPTELLEDLIREKDQTLSALRTPWLNADPQQKAKLQPTMDTLLDQRWELMSMRIKGDNLAENTCKAGPANAS